MNIWTVTYLQRKPICGTFCNKDFQQSIVHGLDILNSVWISLWKLVLQFAFCWTQLQSGHGWLVPYIAYAVPGHRGQRDWSLTPRPLFILLSWCLQKFLHMNMEMIVLRRISSDVLLIEFPEKKKSHFPKTSIF